MHIRGKRLGIWAILVSLIFSVVGPVFAVEPVRAATLPSTVQGFITEDKARTVQAIIFAANTAAVVREYVEVLTGDNNSKGDFNTQVAWLIDQFAAGNIKEGMEIHKLDGLFRNYDWEATYKNVYNSIYHQIAELDEEWGDFISILSEIYRFKNVEGANYEEFRRLVQAGRDTIYYWSDGKKGLLPYLTLAYIGIQILTVMNKNPAVRAEAADMPDFDALIRDLDIGTRADGKVNTQGKRLHKRLNVEEAMKIGGKGDAFPESIYVSTSAFYNDVQRFGNLLIDPPVASYVDSKTTNELRTKIGEAAIAMDADSSNSKDLTNGQGRFSRCGQASQGIIGFPNIGESITAALCSLVILVQDFSIEMLSTSLLILGKVSGIQDLQPAGGETAGFLVSLIPQEFTAEFLELVLDPPPEKSGDNETIIAARSFSPVIKNAHAVILNVVNVILILLFIFIALSNIFQIQVNNYSVQKLFAPIVIGFILASGSWFIVRASIELAAAASGGILTQFRLRVDENGNDENGEVVNKGAAASNNFLSAVTTVSSVGGDRTHPLTETDAGGEKRPSFSKVFQQSVLNFFSLAAAVVVFILAFLFMIRALFLSFLIPLSPIAFFASAVPPLKSVWTKWSKNFFQWLIMPIIAAFWLWLGFVWLASVNFEAAGTNAVQAIIAYLFGMVCFVAAIKSSLSSLSGEAKMAMDKWQGMGKKAWGSTGGRAIGSAVGSGKDIGNTMLNLSPVGDYRRWAKSKTDERKANLAASEKGVNLKALKKAELDKEHEVEHANELRARAHERFKNEEISEEQYNKEIEKIEDHLDEQLKSIENKRKNRVNARRAKQNIMRNLEHDLDKSLQEGVTAYAEQELAQDYKSKQGKRYNQEFALVRDTQTATQIAKEEMNRARNANYSGLKTADGNPKTGAAMVAAERRQVTTNQAEARKIMAEDDAKDQKEHYDRRILVDSNFIQAASDVNDSAKMAAMSEDQRAKTTLMAEEHKNAVKRAELYMKAYVGRDDITNEAFTMHTKDPKKRAEYKDIIEGKGVIDPRDISVKTLKDHQKKVAHILTLHKIIKDSGSSGDYKSAMDAATQLKAIVGEDEGLDALLGTKKADRENGDKWRARVNEVYRSKGVGQRIETNVNSQPTDAFKLKGGEVTPPDDPTS